MIMENTFWSRGYIGQVPFVCQYLRIDGKIVGNKFDPFTHTTSTVLVQFIFFFFISRATYSIVRHLQQNILAAQIIAGIIIGPSFLTHDQEIHAKLFPPGGTLILKTFGYLGFIIHLFVLGVNASTSIIRNLGKKEIMLGVASVICGVGTSFTILEIAKRTIFDISKYHDITLGLSMILIFNSVSPFIVITSFLMELNMINSELGKLVSSVSIVTDFCGWFIVGIMGNIARTLRNKDVMQSSKIIFFVLAYYLTILFILRPLVIRISRRTPEGKPMRESHFFLIIIMVLGVAFCGDLLGHSAGFGAFIFGLVLPDGPPLGMTLIEKFDTISSGILLPIFCMVSGLRTNLYSLKRPSSMIMEFILLMGYLGKFLGTLISAMLIGKMTLIVALPFALILCCKGVLELAVYGSFRDTRLISDELFALAMITMLIVTGICIPLVRYLYDPSSQYINTKRQSILEKGSKGVLKMLVCIHKEDNVPSIIHLLQVAKPRKQSPLCVLVLQLFELIGNKQAILAPYDKADNKVVIGRNPEHVATAFTLFQKEIRDDLRIQHFIAITPYASMDNDICTLAYDRGLDIIILPFHQNYKGIDKTPADSFSTNIRNVNRRVLRKAPCSIGILIDQGTLEDGYQTVNTTSSYNVFVLFLGGADDHEALAYSRRLLENPYVILTVIRIKSLLHNTMDEGNVIDNMVINDFLVNTKNKNNVKFKDMFVNDAEGTTKIVRTIEGNVDLVLVGRYHDPELTAISGLMDWSQWSELGAIGAMLATWDFQFSVLVIQQHQHQYYQLEQQEMLEKHQKQEISMYTRQSSTDSLASIRDENGTMSYDTVRDEHKFYSKDSLAYSNRMAYR